MTEDVYVNTGPDLTKKVRFGRGERQMEMEERGEREEPIEDTYVNPDDQEPFYVTVDDFDSGTQQDATQNNTVQEQHGGSEDSKQNLYIAAAVSVGLCLLLLAGIIILVILYCVLIEEKHNLQSSFDQLPTRPDNLTGLKDEWNTRFDKLQTRLNNMTELKDQCKTSSDDLQTRLNNMIELKDQCKTSFDDLQTRLKNSTELKRILCESHGFTFGDGVCYYISAEKKTWEESRAYCRARQSDLMILKSKAKKELIHRAVKRVLGSEWVWLGLRDSETEGVWKWVDGTPLTISYWHYGEPNNSGEGEGEDCAIITGEWSDASCSRNFYWICEIVF